jgi:hypothetical protein
LAFQITGLKIAYAHSAQPGATASATITWGSPVPHSYSRPLLQYHDEFTETTLADAYVSSWVQAGSFSGPKRAAYVYLPNLSEIDFFVNVSPDTMARMVCESFVYVL